MSGIEHYLPSDKPYGLTYGAWTVEWWRWACSVPDNRSPLIDNNGNNAGINQPEKNVWFLAGTWATEKSLNIPQRDVMVPYGRSILFPVINCEANPVEYPDHKTEKDIIDKVTKDENTIVFKEAIINNIALPPQRVKSDPVTFSLNISAPHDNLKTVDTTAAADGYWIFLKPLPRSKYDLRFGGACEMGRLKTTVKYRLTIE